MITQLQARLDHKMRHRASEKLKDVVLTKFRILNSKSFESLYKLEAPLVY